MMTRPKSRWCEAPGCGSSWRTLYIIESTLALGRVALGRSIRIRIRTLEAAQRLAEDLDEGLQPREDHPRTRRAGSARDDVASAVEPVRDARRRFQECGRSSMSPTPISSLSCILPTRVRQNRSSGW